MAKKQKGFTKIPVSDQAKFTTERWKDSDGHDQWRLRVIDHDDTWEFESNKDGSTQWTRYSKNTHH